MKLLHLIFILAAVQIAFFIFYGGDFNAEARDIFMYANYTNMTSNASYYTDLSNYTTNFTTSSLAGYSSQDFWSSILDFTTKGSGSDIVVLLIIFAGTFWGLALLYRSELTLLSPLFIFLVGVGIPPSMSLWYMVTSDVGAVACDVGSLAVTSNCFLASVMGFASAGILFLMWVMSCIEFWTARSMA